MNSIVKHKVVPQTQPNSRIFHLPFKFLFMKNFLKNTVIVFFLLVINVSCDEKHDEFVGIINRWEVVDFMSIESVMYAKDKEFNPIIEFHENGSYSLQLDLNSCSGSFELIREKGINITTAGCTKICCDSEFSRKFVLMLPQVTSYSIEGNKMKLDISGWGWINLKLHD